MATDDALKGMGALPSRRTSPIVSHCASNRQSAHTGCPLYPGEQVSAGIMSSLLRPFRFPGPAAGALPLHQTRDYNSNVQNKRVHEKFKTNLCRSAGEEVAA